MGGKEFDIIETITYHALALGFIASTFESSGDKGTKESVVLLRELDLHFETPVSDNLIYQNFPAIIFGLPLMLIAAINE